MSLEATVIYECDGKTRIFDVPFFFKDLKLECRAKGNIVTIFYNIDVDRKIVHFLKPPPKSSVLTIERVSSDPASVFDKLQELQDRISVLEEKILDSSKVNINE